MCLWRAPRSGTRRVDKLSLAPRFPFHAKDLAPPLCSTARSSSPAARTAQADLATAEIFDAASGTITPAASALAAPRSGHCAVFLPHNASVLILGGTAAGSAAVPAAELYIPWAGGFTSTGQPAVGRDLSAASPAGADGMLLVAGGKDAAGALLDSGEVYGFATVKTDKADYVPGDTVTITGGGWEAGDTVNLTLHETGILDPDPDIVLTVTADDAGNIVENTFQADPHDLGVRFYLTAVGTRSQAQTTFTDANPGSFNVSPNNPYNLTLDPGEAITAGTTFTYTVTVGGRTVTFPVTASTSVTGVAWASLDKSSISIADGGSDSATVSGTVPCTQTPGTVTLHVVADLTNNNGSPPPLTPSSLSKPVNITVTNAPVPSCAVGTTTTVGSSANPSIYGQSVTFNATVAPTSGSSTPTGSVQFKIDGSDFGSPVTLVGGAATSGSTSSLTVGNHTVDAAYSGAPGFNPSGGTLAGGQTVDQASTTTTITSDLPDPSVVGETITVKYTVTVNPPGGGTPMGTVTVNGGMDSCTGAVVGEGSCLLTLTTAGPLTLTATYHDMADYNFKSSTSPGEPHQVNKRATQTEVTFSDNPVVVGQSTTAKVTVTDTETAGTPFSPSGTVAVTSDSGDTITGLCALTSTATVGVSTCSVTVTPTGYNGGSRTITATFSETAVHLGSSNTATLTVSRRSTSTAVQLTPSTVVTGESSTVAVTVTDTEANGTKQYPTGTIALGSSESSDVFTSTTCSLSNTGTAGVSSCSVSVKPVHVATSPHTITATFTQTNVHVGGSGNANLTVNKADTSTVVTLTSGTNSSVYGQPLTFQAAVAAVAPGSGIPDGNVTFYDGGTCALPGSTLQAATALDGSGHVNFSTSTLPVAGSPHTILACYAGSSDYKSSGGSASQTVNPANTTTTVTSNSSVTFGTLTVPLSATVSAVAPSLATVNEGTVTFTIKDSTGTTTIATVSGVAVSSGSATVTAYNITTPILFASGTYRIYADYVPAVTNPNFNSGSSSPLFGTLTINQVQTASRLTITPLYYNPADGTYSSTNPAPAGCPTPLNSYPACQQYSDRVKLVASLSPDQVLNLAPATSVDFYVGTQKVGTLSSPTGDSGATLYWELSDVKLLEPTPFGTPPTGQMMPNILLTLTAASNPSQTVTAVFGGINPNFVVSNPTAPLNIVQEDARVLYNGLYSFGIPEGATSGTITLSTVVWDISNSQYAPGGSNPDSAYDPDQGDIRNAKVWFVDADSPSTMLCGPVNVGLVNAADITTGQASCSFTGSTSHQSGVYRVGIVVGNY